MKIFLKLIITFLAFIFILGLTVPYSATAENIVDGVSDSISANDAQPGFTDFDPPCIFNQTLPLMIYMNQSTNAIFAAGNGAVLDECGNFGVTGHSPPNFLAWNSSTINFDGSVPALPEVIFFPSLVSAFSVNVGSFSGAGQTATLVALNAAFQPVDSDALTLTPNLQTLSVSAAGIQLVIIVGPSVMVADDINF
jgi:hypothetical protein